MPPSSPIGKARSGILPVLDFDALVDAIADRVVSKLRPSVELVKRTYSGRCPPAGFSRRRWNEIAPTIPGARKAGRNWLCDIDAYDAWLESRQPRRNVAPENASNDVGAWTPEGALEAAGARRQRNGK